MTTDPRQMTTDELNREAASGVMGWTWEVSPDPFYEPHMAWVMPQEDDPSRKCEVRGRDWSPATSIADAWQLVGRLAKSNIRIRLIDDRDRIDKWSVRFYPSSTKIEYITHDDECIAITIAAILAGGEKEKA